MTTGREIAAHYTRGNLLVRLHAALVEDGVDHGEMAKPMTANVSRGFAEARINPIEVLSRKR